MSFCKVDFLLFNENCPCGQWLQYNLSTTSSQSDPELFIQVASSPLVGHNKNKVHFYKLKTDNLKLKTQTGFSLIELMIVLVLITAAIAIFIRFTDTFSRIGRARNQIKSYHLAAKKLEELRNTPFVNLPVSGSFTENGSQGQLTLTDYQEKTDIKQVTVEVFYQDHSIQRRIQLDSLISKYGLNP